MAGPYPDQFPQVSKEHRLAIAHVVLQWAKIDEYMNIAIGYGAWKLGENLSVEVTSPFRQRGAAWRDYGLRRFPAEITRIDSLLGKCSNLHDRRSALLHAHFTPQDIDPRVLVAVSRYMHSRRFKTLKELTPEKIDDYAIQMSKLHRELTNFHHEVRWFE